MEATSPPPSLTATTSIAANRLSQEPMVSVPHQTLSHEVMPPPPPHMDLSLMQSVSNESLPLPSHATLPRPLSASSLERAASLPTPPIEGSWGQPLTPEEETQERFLEDDLLAEIIDGLEEADSEEGNEGDTGQTAATNGLVTYPGPRHRPPSASYDTLSSPSPSELNKRRLSAPMRQLAPRPSGESEARNGAMHEWEKQKALKSVDVSCKYCAGDIRSWRSKLGTRKIWTCKRCFYTVHEKCKKKADLLMNCIPSDSAIKLW